VEPAQVLDLLTDQHVGVETALFGHVAEPSTLTRSDRRAVPPHRSRVEIGQTEDRPHGGGLAGAVRAEEPDDVP
jgi:hypothetical protein